MRTIFPRLIFDETRCSRLVADLQSYRKQRYERLSQLPSEPVHDHHSHRSDAVQTGALLTRAVRSGVYEPMYPDAAPPARGVVESDNVAEL